MSAIGYGSVSHGTVAVGTASIAVMAANPDRKYALLQNDGTVDIYIKLGTAAAVLNTGVRVLANGGTYEMTRGAASVWNGAVQGISTIAAMRMLVTEGA